MNIYMNIRKPSRARACHMLTLVLAVCMLWGAFPALRLEVAADGSGVQNEGIYEWKRVKTQEDLQSGPILLFWEDVYNATWYCMHGSELSRGADYSSTAYKATGGYPIAASAYAMGLQPGADYLYTADECHAWKMEIVDTDGGKANMKRARVFNDSGAQLQIGKDDKVYFVENVSNEMLFTVCTSETACAYSDAVRADMVQIIRDNVCLDFSGNLMKMGSVFQSKDSPNFMMYVGHKTSMAMIREDYTVTSGEVLDVRNTICLTNGATLTVEPGAVLSVSGMLYNNGTIQNYGTVIVQHGGCIGTMDVSDWSYGRLYCKGSEAFISKKVRASDGSVQTQRVCGEGNLIVEWGGKLCINNEFGDFGLTMGSICVNNGIMLIACSMEISESQFITNSRGVTFIGFGLRCSPESFKDLYVTRSLGGMSPSYSMEGMYPIQYGVALFCHSTQNYIKSTGVLSYNGYEYGTQGTVWDLST